ncbi:hypothetical protein BG011_006404 [Mortierella polycephala]|uniref:Alpha-N-acetylglucosaminidase n=1 Tax=Mortierella polycephala TaxID=41804 RepID=A0A9P6TZ22_9FUNG|nr:hypothetical protein BG011_006404 [Mortierella polycephala]
MDSNAHGTRPRPLRIKTLTIALISALCSTLFLLIASSASTHASPLPNQQSRTSFAATHTLTKRAPVQPEEPLYALVRRLLPATYHSHFEFALKPDLIPASSTNVHDTFRILNGEDDVLVIEGATLSALGAGLNYYLRDVCQVELAWSGDRLDALPTVPPPFKNTKEVIRASFVPWRYYMNVVTFGYSFVFWDWKRWEQELDWMVLNGVNMALAMTGQEYRMGNTQGSWGFENDTLLKNDWIDRQWELQIQIMTRMQEFNITALMPSFQGFVPRELAEKYPDTKFETASRWVGFPDPYTTSTFVPSTDPLFATLSQQYIQLQRSMYEARGISDTQAPKHYYLLDLYNELQPTCMEPDCLQKATSGVMKALRAADPKAVWVMQGWFLVSADIWKPAETKAFFDGIRETNDGRDAFVIDLYSEVIPLWNSTEGYFGIDWGWSMLNNFGGGQGLYGTLPAISTEPFAGYNQYPKTMRGMGITMEGINNNEYLYQLVFDIPWESVESTYPPSSIHATLPSTNSTAPQLNQTAFDGANHLKSYIKRRYGPEQTTDAILEAWTTLSQTVWDCGTGQVAQSKSILDFAPAIDMNRTVFMVSTFWYDHEKVVRAWTQLVQATNLSTKPPSRSLKTSASRPNILFNVSSFKYDLVDVTREVMAAIVLPGLHLEFVEAYNDKDLKRTRSIGNLVLEVISDMDRVLNTHTHFMLGPWIRDARAATLAKGNATLAPGMERYADYLESNARNQVTWWGPAGEGSLEDYGSKHWGGLVKDYYYHRWQIFVDRMVSAVKQGHPLDTETYLQDLMLFESAWQKETTCLGGGCSLGAQETDEEKFAVDPVEDTVEVVQDLWDRWGQMALRFAKENRK